MNPAAPMRRVEALAALVDGAGALLLEEVERHQHPGPAEVTRWRKVAPAEVVAAAMDVAAGRRSLQGRRDDWRTFWADREGAAQASDDASAAWKAHRLASMQEEAVDLCCGCGADLVALRRVLPSVRGVDLREERAWMAARNAGCDTVVADATQHRCIERVVHLDPARRDESTGRRRHAWNDLTPGPGFVADLARRTEAMAVKLGPGVEIPPAERPPGSELAFLSRDGTLTQAVLLTGRAAHHPGRNTAVRLVDGSETSGVASWSVQSGSPGWPPCTAWGRFVAEPDPSLERSGLLGDVAGPLELRERFAGLGLCTRDARPQGTPAEAWFRWFERLDTLPARLPALERRLRDLGAGEVHVKVRGGVVDADGWSRALRGGGEQPLVVLVHRAGAGAEAVIARRI